MKSRLTYGNIFFQWQLCPVTRTPPPTSHQWLGELIKSHSFYTPNARLNWRSLKPRIIKAVNKKFVPYATIMGTWLYCSLSGQSTFIRETNWITKFLKNIPLFVVTLCFKFNYPPCLTILDYPLITITGLTIHHHEKEGSIQE